MYLSQTNGPAYCRLVASLGRTMQPYYPNPWTPNYGGDYSFNGDFAFDCNPVLVSEPIPVVDFLGLSALDGQHTAEPNLMAFEKPLNNTWSGEVDWDRYGSRLDVVNQFNHFPRVYNPRENEVSHRRFTGTVFDIDVPFFDYHTVSYQGIWYAYAPKFDVLDGSPYREFRATGFNSDGFLTFEYRSATSDPPSVNRVPFTDYWLHTRAVLDQIAVKGYLSGRHGVGDWPDYNVELNPGHLLTIKNVIDRSSKGPNRWHFDIEYDWEILARQGPDWWKTTYRVHQDIYAGFYPVNGANNPFDWNVISDDVFQVTDHSNVTPLKSEVYYSSHLYSRYPIDEVVPPVDITGVMPPTIPTYKIRAFAQPLQSPEGERSRLMNFRRYGNITRDPDTYVKSLSRQVEKFENDFRASAFYSASNGLHEHIDVVQANHIENLSQLGGLLSLLPDLPALGRLVAKAAKRDPGAIVDLVDFLSDVILKFRFGQKPTSEDLLELASLDIRKELETLLRANAATVYGKFVHNFSRSEIEQILPGMDGELQLVTRSKVRFQTDMTTLLANYLTANAMGMMPTLSRLWAVVPFSFVVDWFTRLDDRLQSIDDQLLWMVVGSEWTLHSFRLTYYPAFPELAAYNLRSSEEDPFGLTWYSRELSLCIPRLTEARFDYRASSTSPDLVTVGALVWQKR